MKTLITTAVLFTGLAWSRGPWQGAPHTIHEQGTMDQGFVGQGSGFALLSKKLSRIAERVEYSIRIPFSALDKICSSM